MSREALVYAAGKVSKAKRRSAVAASVLIDGCTRVDQHKGFDVAEPALIDAHMLAVAVGVKESIKLGANAIRIVTPSKAIMRAINGSGGGKLNTYRSNIIAGWVIYWTRENFSQGWTVETMALAEMVGVNSLLAMDILPEKTLESLPF